MADAALQKAAEGDKDHGRRHVKALLGVAHQTPLAVRSVA